MTAVPERLVVLLADDDPNDLKLIRRSFQRISTVGRLVEVSDGDRALAYLQGQGLYADRTLWPLPRLLVLDEWMPRCPGLDALRWVRGDPRYRFMPVIVLSDCLPPSPTELTEKLRAASCVKAPTPKAMSQALQAAMFAAVGLAWQSPASRDKLWCSNPGSPSLALRHRPECT